MITNIVDHNKQAALIKQKVFNVDDFKLFTSVKENVLVSIKKESDMLFANLNKYHLFEEEVFHKYDSFYKKIIYNQLLNELDLKHHYKYLTEEVIQLKGIIPNHTQATIYCSFHYGSYVHAASALCMLKKNFSVVSRSTKGENIVEWDVKVDLNGNKIEYFNEFTTIDPEAIDASFQIYNTLRNGKDVLIYLDRFNNTQEKTSKRSKIFELLNSKMFITSGIPEISKKLSVPIVPLICERQEDYKICITFYEAIFKGEFSNKDYVKKAIQECVNALAIHLKKHPEQWDHWPSIHNHLIKTPKAIKKNIPLWKRFISLLYNSKTKKQFFLDNDIVTLNSNDYEIFELNDYSFIINTKNYDCFKISDHLMKILKRLSESEYKAIQVKEVINASLYADLFEKNVLVIKNNVS